jgi:hypothetical protein
MPNCLEHDTLLAGTGCGRVQIRRRQLPVRERRTGGRTEIQLSRCVRHRLRKSDPYVHARSTGNVPNGLLVEANGGRVFDVRENTQVRVTGLEPREASESVSECYSELTC